jgi:hypothetical protein
MTRLENVVAAKSINPIAKESLSRAKGRDRRNFAF